MSVDSVAYCILHRRFNVPFKQYQSGNWHLKRVHPDVSWAYIGSLAYGTCPRKPTAWRPTSSGFTRLFALLKTYNRRWSQILYLLLLSKDKGLFKLQLCMWFKNELVEYVRRKCKPKASLCIFARQVERCCEVYS